MIWYLAKISFIQQDERGNNRVVTQDYLFDAVSYTDAEARAYAHCAEELKEFSVKKITQEKYNEVFYADKDLTDCGYWKVKTNYIVFDERSQKEKKVPFLFLVCADDLKEAHDVTIEKLGKVQDYRVESITSTNLLDIIRGGGVVTEETEGEEVKQDPEE